MATNTNILAAHALLSTYTIQLQQREILRNLKIMQKEFPEVGDVETSHVEDLVQLGTERSLGELSDGPEIRKINKKIDLRITFVLGLIYTISVIDRVNLPNAVIAGMDKDLDLIGNRYEILVLVLFPFYAAFQPPMTALCRRIGPRLFLPFIVTSWGIVMMCHGFVHDWRAMIPLRCLVGLFEAGYFSSAVYLISAWYIRKEAAKRNAAFYLTGAFISGFGGPLAYGLSRINGVGGYEGWRWIFIIEGLITIVIGLAAFLLIVDFPEKAPKSWRFLNEQEAKIVCDRIAYDRADVVLTPFELSGYLANALDWKIWCYATNFGVIAIANYSSAYFFPIILKDELGYSELAAQCLQTPGLAFSVLLGMGQAYFSDRLGLRGPFLVVNGFILILGIAMLGFTHITGVRYFGCFLVVGAGNASVGMSLTYQANNIAGQWRRAFCSATLVGAGAIGGIVGSLTFRDQDAPSYHPGLYTCFTAAAILILSVAATSTHFYTMNRKQAAGKAVIEGVPGFRYTY